MKISVITVSYNSANTILDTLRSVEEQTYTSVEHIIIDGGSTDGTQEIVKKGKRISKLISEKDDGIFDAMNKGIELSSGDVISILNSDDVFKDNTILEKIASIFEHSETDAVYGDVIYFNEKNPSKAIRRFNSGHFRPESIAWGWMPAHPSLFLRKKIYDEIGLFKTDYKIAGDFEFIARAFHKNRFKKIYIPEVLVKMRMGGISTSGLASTIKLNIEVLKACRENNIETNIFKILSKYPRKLLELLPYKQ